MPENRVLTFTRRVASPLGDLLLASDGRSLTGLYLPPREALPGPVEGEDSAGARALFDRTARQLEAYFAGELTQFDLPLEPAGTPFQLRVWQELRAVPYGATASYGEIAARIGQPTAARAVGLANGRNPISIIIPCHRVIGAGGSLVGYGGGLDRKKLLLDLEARGRARAQGRDAAAPA